MFQFFLRNKVLKISSLSYKPCVYNKSRFDLKDKQDWVHCLAIDLILGT